MFTLDVQLRDVTMGDSANFICCAGGTNITTVYWEIEGKGNNYHDCSDQGFCVRNMSACRTLEIDTTQINRTQTIVHCVVEQMFGGRTNRSISTGQLTVRDMTCKFKCIPPILIYACTINSIVYIKMPISKVWCYSEIPYLLITLELKSQKSFLNENKRMYVWNPKKTKNKRDGMTPQHFHVIPTSCTILLPLTQICFVCLLVVCREGLWKAVWWVCSAF